MKLRHTLYRNRGEVLLSPLKFLIIANEVLTVNVLVLIVDIFSTTCEFFLDAVLKSLFFAVVSDLLPM